MIANDVGQYINSNTTAELFIITFLLIIYC